VNGVRRTLIASLAAAALAAAAGSALAQEKDEPTRSVKGVVMDEQEHPLQAVVQLKNMRTLDVKSFHTDGEGRYYFYGLDPNVDYEVKASSQGMKDKTRKVSSFSSERELFYAFELKRE